MSEQGSEREPLEKLAEEFVERIRRGERPSLTEYVQKHPALAADIRELFPALVEMEELRPGGDQATGPFAGPLADDGPVPQQLGEYRILRELARGGMGVVYEAVQESLGRHVALKVLAAQGLANPGQRERFRREAQAAAKLHHTNIVPVFGTGEHAGVHYYAMQFIQGQGLDAVLGEVRRLRDENASRPPEEQGGGPEAAAEVARGLLSGRFPGPATQAGGAAGAAGPGAAAPPQAATANERGGSTSAVLGMSSAAGSRPGAPYFREVARLGVQAAEALAHAHQQGVLHRDIKPSNLLLDARGTVWLTDFGLAKAEGAGELTSPGDVVGTLRYMAPERFQGQADTRSDIYSLGLTLYEMLTLRPAFEDSNRARLVEQVLRAEPPRPRNLDGHIPRDLELIALKAMAKSPAERYTTARELADDLERFLKDEPIWAKRPTLVQRARKWLRRHPAVMRSVVAVLAMTVVVLGVSSALILREIDRKDKALKEKREALAEKTEALTEKSRQEGIAKEKAKIAREKQAEAERQMATTNMLYNFLVLKLLRAPDPELALGRKVTVLDVLNNVEGKVDAAFPDRPLTQAEMHFVIGKTYLELGEYAKAESHLAAAVERRTRHLGREAPLTLKAMNALAVVLQRRGKLQPARSLQEETVRLKVRVLGAEHRDTLQAKQNLAVVLDDLGKLEEARKLDEEVFAIRTRVLGPAHHDTLLSLEILAQSLIEQGKWKEARQRYEKVLAQLGKLRPAEHPELLRVRHNLASLLRDQGKLEEARKMFAAVVAGRERILGRDHPRTLLSRSRLGFVLARQGKLPQARKMLEEAKEGLVRSLGEEHEYTLGAMNDLAAVFLQQGQWKQARTLLEKVLAQRTRSLGPEHPGICTPMMNLANLLRRLGKLPEARRYIEKCLALCKQVYGPEHRKTADTMGELAGLLFDQRQLQPAFDLCQRTIKLKKRILGPKHPSTLHSLANMALILGDQGKRKEAWDLLEKTLQDFEEVLGPKHPSTLQTLHLLAYMLLEEIRRKDLRRLPEARKRFEEVIALSAEALGPDHPSTLDSRWGLLEVLFAMDPVPPKAVKMCHQIVARVSRVHGPDHAITRNARNICAGQLRNARKYEEARKLHQENLEQCQRSLGPKHPDTIFAKKRLAETLHSMNRFADASKLFAEVLADLSRSPTFGPGHRVTLEARTDYAVCLSNAGKFAESRKLHEETLELSRRSLGPEDPDTLDTIKRLSQIINVQAFKLWQAGKLPQAEKTFREGLAVIKPVESKFASINDNYRGALAQLCGNLARFLVLSPQVKVDVAKEAVTLAQKAVKLMPQLRLWWNTLCLAQYRAGNFKAARATMTQSLARSKGGDCRDWFLLAMIQWRQGEKDQARRWFDRAVQQMETQHLKSDVARTFRAEAAKVLGIKDKKD
jgi:serine/threonine protein kinase/Tfp pilus assembly protein PilF